MRNLFKKKYKTSLTKIEDALFRGQNRAHAVMDFVYSNNCILIKLAPWIEFKDEIVPDNNAIIEARFSNADIKSKETYEKNTEDIKYLWDVIGFDNKPILDNRWSFCLHSDCIEIIFEADWTEIEFK